MEGRKSKLYKLVLEGLMRYATDCVNAGGMTAGESARAYERKGALANVLANVVIALPENFPLMLDMAIERLEKTEK